MGNSQLSPGSKTIVLEREEFVTERSPPVPLSQCFRGGRILLGSDEDNGSGPACF